MNFAHDHSRLPVGKTLALAKSPSGIRARFTWLDGVPDVAAVHAAFEAGVLGASVEFVPVEAKPNGKGGVHFAKSVLTGWALTGNPANPQCVRMLKSLDLARRGGNFEFDLASIDAHEGDDQPVGLSRAVVLSTLREVVPAEVARRVRSRLPALADDGRQIVALDDEIEAGLSRDDVIGAMREAIGPMAGAAVRRAVNAARGRLE